MFWKTHSRNAPLLIPVPTCTWPEFWDQFAFSPSGLTTSAIIAILHTVRMLLTDNQYVHVFLFDFSKHLILSDAGFWCLNWRSYQYDTVDNWIKAYTKSAITAATVPGNCHWLQKSRLGSFLSHAKHLGFCDRDLSTTATLFSDADAALSTKLLRILDTQSILNFPEKWQINYELRDRCHNMTLVAKNPQLSGHNFIIRMFYKRLY